MSVDKFAIHQWYLNSKWYIIKKMTVRSLEHYAYDPNISCYVKSIDQLEFNMKLVNEFNGQLDKYMWSNKRQYICFKNKTDANNALEWVMSLYILEQLSE